MWTTTVCCQAVTDPRLRHAVPREVFETCVELHGAGETMCVARGSLERQHILC